MRKLASIQRILEIDPIPGKDRIGLATIEGWHVIVRKSDFDVGDLCVFFEIDSVLPEREEFAFLKDKHYRVKTMKMAGVVSQGLAMPLSILPETAHSFEEGDDVTDILGVTQYEPDMEDLDLSSTWKPKKKKHWYDKTFLMKFRWFRKLVKSFEPSDTFPTEYVRKTDEVRIQNAPWFVTKKSNQPWVLTEKLDGTSCTFLLVKHGCSAEYYVCSRNRRLPVNDNSVYWYVSEKYNIKSVLDQILVGTGQEWCCIQGECIGPGILKNKYKLKEPEFYAFNLIRGNLGRANSIDAKALLKHYGIPFVPIVDVVEILPSTVEDMLAKAHGQSMINKDVLREGLVCRSWDAKLSFKAVDPLFLLEWNE